MTVSPRQQRLRLLAAAGAKRLLRRVEPGALSRPEPPAPPPPPPPPPEASPPPPPRAFAGERGASTAALRERIGQDDVAAAEARIAADGPLQRFYGEADRLERDRLLLAFGTYLQIPEIVQSTGLPTVQPPEEIHAMARGPIAAAGGLYEADLVADALASAGLDIAAKRSALDFGCSSGRVLRVLSRAFPDVSWHGCDPNGPAIEWAQEAISGVRFFRSHDRPPLDMADGSLDLVYAISIWSHFSPKLGLDWLEEMRRLIAPGGHLVLTTHGTTTIRHDGERELRQPDQLTEIAAALVREGAWYLAEFGDDGDWGVVNPDWGTAFVTPEWLLSHVTPHWRLLELVPGRNAGNQDVYLLERV